MTCYPKCRRMCNSKGVGTHEMYQMAQWHSSPSKVIAIKNDDLSFVAWLNMMEEKINCQELSSDLHNSTYNTITHTCVCVCVCVCVCARACARVCVMEVGEEKMHEFIPCTQNNEINIKTQKTFCCVVTLWSISLYKSKGRALKFIYILFKF